MSRASSSVQPGRSVATAPAHSGPATAGREAPPRTSATGRTPRRCSSRASMPPIADPAAFTATGPASGPAA
ncbi:hypothetical protein [Nocardiopsis chromatogenes]|uniref:hypothetical protein n=1 Tax=Nocardiopsis chromatogenes TaxID=280239 RepID=UPI00035F16F5|nr:hypothetical protein [Nocardiopsis chromatogenes]